MFLDVSDTFARISQSSLYNCRLEISKLQRRLLRKMSAFNQSLVLIAILFIM